MLLSFHLLAVVNAAAVYMHKRGLVARQVPGSIILSPAQIESMMVALRQAGAPADANVMQVQTSANQRLEILTNTGTGSKVWQAESTQPGDAIAQIMTSKPVIKLKRHRQDAPGQNKKDAQNKNAPGQTKKDGKADEQRDAAQVLVAAESLVPGQSFVSAPAPAAPPTEQSLAAPVPDLKVNTVENGRASAASVDGNTAVDGANAFAESRGRGASVSNTAGSAFISGQGTVAASGATPGGLVVAVINTTPAAETSGATLTDANVNTNVNAVSRATSPGLGGNRNFNVLVGGNNGLAFSPNQISDAQLGDTVTFIFGSSNHTVTQSSFENPCTFNGVGADSGFLASTNNLTTGNTEGAPVIQYDIATLAPQFFFCAQGMHCMRGMVFEINAARAQPFASFVKVASEQGAAAMATAVSAAVVRAAVNATAGNTTDALIIGTSQLTTTLAEVNAIATPTTRVEETAGLTDIGSGINISDALAPAATDTSTLADLNDTRANVNGAGTTATDLINTNGACLASDGVSAVDNAGGCFQVWAPQQLAAGAAGINAGLLENTATSFVNLGLEATVGADALFNDTSSTTPTTTSSSGSSRQLQLLVSTTTTQTVTGATAAALSLKQQVEAFGLPYPGAGSVTSVSAKRNLENRAWPFKRVQRALGMRQRR